MTEMFKLQEFIVPQADVCVEEELYFRTLSDLEVKYNLKELPELEYYHDGITDFLVAIY